MAQKRICKSRNLHIYGGRSMCSLWLFMLRFQEVNTTACVIWPWQWQSTLLEKPSKIAYMSRNSATCQLRDLRLIFNSALPCHPLRGSFYLPEIFQMWLFESWCAREHRQRNLSALSISLFLPPVSISKKSMFSEAPVEGKQKLRSWPIRWLEETVGGDRQ